MPRKTKAKAAPQQFILTSTQTSPLLQAAELATALLKHTHTVSLDDMFQKIADRDETVLKKLAALTVTEDQLTLIEHHGANLALLRNLPSVNLTECPACGAVAAVVGSGSRKCTMKLGCPGMPAKSGVARKVPVEPRTPQA